MRAERQTDMLITILLFLKNTYIYIPVSGRSKILAVLLITSFSLQMNQARDDSHLGSGDRGGSEGGGGSFDPWSLIDM